MKYAPKPRRTSKTAKQGDKHHGGANSMQFQLAGFYIRQHLGLVVCLSGAVALVAGYGRVSVDNSTWTLLQLVVIIVGLLLHEMRPFKYEVSTRFCFGFSARQARFQPRVPLTAQLLRNGHPPAHHDLRA